MFNNLGDSLKGSGIDVARRKVSFRDDGFAFHISGLNGFEIRRNFEYKTNTIYHNYLKIPKEFQGKGIAKKLFEALLREYEDAGIRKIKVTANIDIGGYAWARYNFSALNKREVVRIINRSKNKAFKTKALAKIRYHYTRHGDDSPFPMKRLADTEGGKGALFDTSWDGEIDLKNKIAMKRLKSYLRK